MTSSESPAGALISAARHDLEDVEALLARGGDRLVALVLLARAAKLADEATFTLLDSHGEKAASERVVYTHGGYDRPEGQDERETK